MSYHLFASITSRQMRTERDRERERRRDCITVETCCVTIATGSGATSLQTPDTQASQISLNATLTATHHWIHYGLDVNIMRDDTGSVKLE